LVGGGEEWVGGGGARGVEGREIPLL